MKVLLTGATGFLGRHLLPELARRHEVVAVVRRVPERPDARVTWVERDLEMLDVSTLPDGVGGVVHLAARIDDPFGHDPRLSDLAGVNILASLRLLEWAAQAGVRRFVYGSTGGIVGAAPGGCRASEADPPRPPNPYNLTKHLAEQALTAYAWPFTVCSLRYYAPYARDGSNPLVIHLLQCLTSGTPIEVGEDDGPWMNPVHVEDAVRLTVRALEVPDPPGVVNVAGPDPVSRVRFVGLLAGALGVTPVFDRTTGPSPSWIADITRLAETLGAPRITVAEGIAREWGRATPISGAPLA